MINSQKQNNLVRSWAVGTSLLLHGLVLIGLGAGSFQGDIAKPNELVVYLAMPSAMPVRVPLIKASITEIAVAGPVTPQQIQQVHSEPVEKEPAQVVEAIITEAPPNSKINQSPDQVVQNFEQPAEKIAKIETVAPTLRPSPSALRPVLQPNSGPETSDVFSDSPSQVAEVFLDTRHQTPVTALLAFAGNPAALGMLAREALGPDLVEAEALSLPEPSYPILSRKRGEEGRVIIEIEISAKGKVLRAQIARSSSYTRLDRAALEAVKKADFSPATEFGLPVESELKVAYRFELKQ